MIKPHGGELINRIVPRESIQLNGSKKNYLNPREVSNLEMIATLSQEEEGIILQKKLSQCLAKPFGNWSYYFWYVFYK